MPEIQSAKAIRVAMAQRDINNLTLSKMLDVERQTITRWRTQGCNSLKTLEKIAKSMDLTADELMELGK